MVKATLISLAFLAQVNSFASQLGAPNSRGRLPLHLSTKENALAFDNELAPFSASSAVAEEETLAIDNEPAPFAVSSLGERGTLAVSTAAALVLLTTTHLPTTVASTYASLIFEHPIPTKSLTAGVICGVGDAIAQFRDSTRKEFNYQRMIRFAGKGCLGGIIWTWWYDTIDQFLNLDSEYNIYTVSGLTPNVDWIREHVSIVTVALSVLIEQFIWCPIVFGLWDIPVSTVLNGGSFSTVRQEVPAKLGGLLENNAKVWTLANAVIYSCPVEWRTPVSSVVDIFWQSIVSDVAADCGSVEDDICEVPDYDSDWDDQIERVKDYSFFAEKSRI